MNYEDWEFKPMINGRTLVGDMVMEDIGLVPMSSEDVTEIMLEVFGFVY